jgi:hypothetical protein
MRTVLLGISLFAATLVAAKDLRSGPQVGERPLPFTSNMVTGPHRGKQYCYVCELKEEPALLVFARKLDDPTARLLREVRDAVQARRKEKLFGWMVFLGPEGDRAEAALEREVDEFVRRNGASGVPVSVLGDPQGPPGYLIAPEAAATVIVFQNGKVLHNRAYTARSWNDRTAEGALKPLDKVLKPAPPNTP